MDECTCHYVDNPWTYYGIVEPGGAMEPNPMCPEHFPENVNAERLRRSLEATKRGEYTEHNLIETKDGA